MFKLLTGSVTGNKRKTKNGESLYLAQYSYYAKKKLLFGLYLSNFISLHIDYFKIV